MFDALKSCFPASLRDSPNKKLILVDQLEVLPNWLNLNEHGYDRYCKEIDEAIGGLGHFANPVSSRKG